MHYLPPGKNKYECPSNGHDFNEGRSVIHFRAVFAFAITAFRCVQATETQIT